MQRSDWFAVLVAVFVLGAGAYLSTFPTEIIRNIGLILMVVAVFGIFIWFAIERRWTVSTWGPWILIISGPVIGFLWLHFAPAPNETNRPAQEHTAADRPLTALSNTQLREAVFSFATKMREFETNTDASTFSGGPSYPKDASPEQKTEISRAFANRMTQLHQQKTLALSNNYLGSARDLKEEVTLRLNKMGILPPYVSISRSDEIGVTALEEGFLAGPHPVASAANYIEKLARRLPADSASPPSNVMGPIIDNKGIVTQDQKGDNRQ